MAAAKAAADPAADEKIALLAKVSDPQQRFLLKVSIVADAIMPPKKRSTNTLTRGGATAKYASLADTMDEIEPKLVEQGLAHNFLFRGDDLIYRVWDIETGWLEESNLRLPLDGLTGNVWQEIGKGFTYLRRYLATTYWNLVPEDNDANGAPRREAPTAAVPTPATATTTAAPDGGGSL